MYNFDTKVQYLKHMVLKEVARLAFEDRLLESLTDIPKTIVPGKEATMRCCVYKERAILSERVKLAMGGDRSNPNVVEVIDIACDECPVGGYEVTNACRGCLAHHCEKACKKGAISYDRTHTAYIDKDKCIECGACAKVCPYTAIVHRKRPCQNACKVKAISMNDQRAASIEMEKCIQCGACIYQCPFGAIMDKSYILNVVSLLKNSRQNGAYKVYAMLAPSFAGQFDGVSPGQVAKGLEELGFYRVLEAARGADMVAEKEAAELAEKGLLLSSCCPSFVKYIETAFPALLPLVSENLSPMATLGKRIKEEDPSARIVFIGPCTSKKEEAQKEEVKEYIDAVLTFEELQALFASRDLDVSLLEERALDSASPYGRGFACSGGLTEAVKEALKEQELDFDPKCVSCDGIEECRVALLKLNKQLLDCNFVEGMACSGGCIGGAGCLSHKPSAKALVEKHGKSATAATIKDALTSKEQ